MLDSGIKNHNILRIPPNTVTKTGRFIVVLNIEATEAQCEQVVNDINALPGSTIHGKICEDSLVAKIITVQLGNVNQQADQLKRVSLLLCCYACVNPLIDNRL